MAAASASGGIIRLHGAGALVTFFAAVQGVVAGAAVSDEGSCPAGGSGPGCASPGPTDKDMECVKWRQTGGCSPNGARERHGDKPCSEIIETGSSGYCQCGSGGHKMRVRESTCDHRPFDCATECLQWRRYTCIGWRQTGGCSADGDREPNNDRGCDDEIGATMSGFCECGGGRIIRKPGCEHGEYEEPFSCGRECSAEPGLYEELDIDSGASEKAIKQAFRKLSLKYHPDKTRGNAVLSARFAAIREAYDIIGDAKQRAIYDVAGLRMVHEARNNKVEQGPEMNGEVSVELEKLYNGAEWSMNVQRKAICRGCRDVSTPRCQKCSTPCANEVELVNVRMGPMVMQQQREVPSKEKCRMETARLTISVEPGMSPGDTIVFKGMGEQQPKKVPGDLVLKIQEHKHAVFRRTGVDLHTEIDITLEEALLGFTRTITHLDGRLITFGFDGVTKPFALMRIENEGMPYKGDATQHGNLFVKCNIVMPEDGRQWLESTAAALKPVHHR